ncbi:hypothetical protein E2562_022319 [Oryza meyeriana var. granulata]|uniref:Uncharacterized protein n=1 Tax=Oryza meyeriana var. granulata TaxID=110450 RepID=A0A6G1D830_9ORYZ|nr:hypothetical protein E2562_022319 [Oryza meyeriana var. granulata]
MASPFSAADELHLVLQYCNENRFIIPYKDESQLLFIHQYSGSMPPNSAVTIFSSYFLLTTTMIYTPHLTAGLPGPVAGPALPQRARRRRQQLLPPPR